MENKRLEYIPVEKLHPHPDNPRKDLGDLSELAESIKANGVLQNLTVVKGHHLTDDEWKELSAKYSKDQSEEIRQAMNSRYGNDGYTVIIGHRRLAAAKLAGLKEVPCIVAYMDRHEELQTMLLENIQRTDLTVYEQAQGFQMMMDLGDTVEDIAAASGFSQSTVRRRVKLLELDQKKFKESEARGATLQDYMELDKLSDPKAKNKVLDTIGTPNFRAVLAAAVENEQFKKKLDGWREQVATFATKIKKRDEVDGVKVPMSWVRQYSKWTSQETIDVPDKDDKRKYFYTDSSTGIIVYCEAPAETAEEERRHDEEKENFERMNSRFKEITARHYNLRLEFIKNFKATKKSGPEIMRFAVKAITRHGYSYFATDNTLVGEIIGFDTENAGSNDCDKSFDEVLTKFLTEKPEYTLLICAYSGIDGESQGYWEWGWSNSKRIFEHKENMALNTLYDALIALGYEMSDEEKAMRDGTHELFSNGQKENDEEVQQ